jgi:hypothetical protein
MTSNGLPIPHCHICGSTAAMLISLPDYRLALFCVPCLKTAYPSSYKYLYNYCKDHKPEERR